MPSGLAWCSIAVGLSQLVAPDALARLIGLRPSPRTRTAMRAVGIRELTMGYGLLTHRRSMPWFWSRLAGDALDMSLLVAGVGRRADDRTRATRALFAIASGAAVNLYAAARTHRVERPVPMTAPEPGANRRLEMPARRALALVVDMDAPAMSIEEVHLAHPAVRTAHRTITVSKPAAELYAFWRNFENLPSFMRQLDSLTCTDGARSHWVARAPGGSRLAWDAEVVADVPGELIAWQTVPDAAVHSAATVTFIPTSSGRGSTVHFSLEYTPIAGALGEVVARLFGVEPAQQLETDLAAFKRLMELGTDDQASGGTALGDLPVPRTDIGLPSEGPP